MLAAGLLISTIACVLGVAGWLELRLRRLGHRGFARREGWAEVEPGGRLVQSHPTLGYRYLPGAYTVTLHDAFSFRMTHGEDTLRVTSTAGDQALDDRPEVWIFGCSLTHGWSVDDEETFAWLLQRELADVRVVNLGVGGYGTVQSFLQFREALATRGRPVLCLLCYAGIHDARNSFSRSRRKQLVPHEGRLGRFSQPVARLNGDGSVRWRLAAMRYRQPPVMRHSALVHALEEAYNRLEERMLRGREISHRLIDQFQHVAAAAGVPFVLVGMVGDGGTRDTLRLAAERGIVTFDASVDTSRPGYNNLPYDGHPSAKAHREYAQLLIGFLRAEVDGFGWSAGSPVAAQKSG